MNLNKIEKELLIYFYERDFNIESDKNWSINKFSLKEVDDELKINEIAFYIEKLEKSEYLIFTGKWYHGIHQYNEKYNNGACHLIPSNIEVSNDGKEFIIELKKTKFTKLLEVITENFLDIMFQVKKSVISHIIALILGGVLTKFFPTILNLLK